MSGNVVGVSSSVWSGTCLRMQFLGSFQPLYQRMAVSLNTGVIRNGEGILVTGDTLVRAGDHVVVFCLSMMIKKIEKYFN